MVSKDVYLVAGHTAGCGRPSRALVPVLHMHVLQCLTQRELFEWVLFRRSGRGRFLQPGLNCVLVVGRPESDSLGVYYKALGSPALRIPLGL